MTTSRVRAVHAAAIALTVSASCDPTSTMRRVRPSRRNAAQIGKSAPSWSRVAIPHAPVQSLHGEIHALGRVMDVGGFQSAARAPSKCATWRAAPRGVGRTRRRSATSAQPSTVWRSSSRVIASLTPSGSGRAVPVSSMPVAPARAARRMAARRSTTDATRSSTRRPLIPTPRWCVRPAPQRRAAGIERPGPAMSHWPKPTMTRSPTEPNPRRS